MKILVVEDDPGIVDVLKYALTKEGHVIDCVARGAEAIAKADAVDFILLDVGCRISMASRFAVASGSNGMSRSFSSPRVPRRSTVSSVSRSAGTTTWPSPSAPVNSPRGSKPSPGEESRVQNFLLSMQTDFTEINFPVGTGSPTKRTADKPGYTLEWNYPDEIGARSIGMDMPKVLNPGPTAARITFFAPVSLLFFFTVLVILCLLRQVDLHPMNFFFLSAGCFAFQLLFAYLVDLIPIGVAFFLSAVVSLILVSGYLRLVAGWPFARLAGLAQFAYMVLFSYSFFFDGLTGLTITIGAILTLALLMITTAQVNWTERFAARRKAPLTPPPLSQTGAC